jgi:ribokinase
LLSGLPTQPVLQLDGFLCDAAVELARRTREHDGLIVLDTGSPKGRTQELLQTVDVVNAPRRFLSQYFDDDDIDSGGRRLLELGAKIVTITDGSRGAWIFTQTGEHHHQPAFEIEIVDSTGAGDVFTGGLIHAVLQEWPADRVLRFASACAALKCTRLGNRDVLPSVEDVEGFLDSNS